MKRSVTLIFFLIIVLSLLVVGCNEKQPEIKLAEIEEISINSIDFLAELDKAKMKYNLPDNGMVRKNILTKMINNKVFLLEAKRLGFDNDATAEQQFEKINIQNLLDEYTKREIYTDIDLSEENIKKLYVQNEIKIKARHLYGPTKKEADSLYKLLEKGKTFSELARNVFNDPELKETGGDLGYFNITDMELEFSKVVSNMRIGEISKPVKTNYGYSIIKVDDRKGNPFVTEQEYLKKRNETLHHLKTREKSQALKMFVKTKVKDLDITFNQEVLTEIFMFFKNDPNALKEIFNLEKKYLFSVTFLSLMRYID